MLLFILAVIAALSCFAAWQSEQKRKRCKAGTWHRAQLVDFSSHKEKRGSGMYRTTVTVSELTVILADDREGVRRTVTSERRSAKRYRGQTEIDIFRIPAEYGAGVRLTKNRGEADIIISHRRDEADRPDALYLIPRTVTLGVGCRKGIAPEAVMETVTEVLRDTGIFPEALCGIASIDLKKDEPALHILAETWKLPLTFYTADQLNRLPGTFTESGFVRSVTGVDCVCERSAVRLAGAGAELILKKRSRAGVTAALAIKYH